MSRKTICYIDGFNLYYGLRNEGLKKYYWLDLTAVADLLLPPDHTLIVTKYFTTPIRGGSPSDRPERAKSRDESRIRQNSYLDALATIPNLMRFYGHYMQKPFMCPDCRTKSIRDEEKMTDVQIATEMLVDAFQGSFDTAILISADSDLVPPICKIKKIFPEKKIVVAFPPGKKCRNLEKNADVMKPIWKRTLACSQLPDPVRCADGRKIFKPTEWS